MYCCVCDEFGVGLCMPYIYSPEYPIYYLRSIFVVTYLPAVCVCLYPWGSVSASRPIAVGAVIAGFMSCELFIIKS